MQAINPTPPWIMNIGMLVAGAGLSLLGKVYFSLRQEARTKMKEAQEAADKMKDRITAMESRLALVDAAVTPISTAFQAMLIKELTHFHTPEMDALLVKVGPPNTLTEEEHERLSTLLLERSKTLNGTISATERDAAAILPAVMKRAQLEQEQIKTAKKLDLQIVSTVREEAK